MNGLADETSGQDRHNPEVESVIRRHDPLFNIIYIMRTVMYGAGGLWWSDLKATPSLIGRQLFLQDPTRRNPHRYRFR